MPDDRIHEGQKVYGAVERLTVAHQTACAKEQSQQQANKREKRAQPTAKKKASVVGAGLPAPLHEERVIARARRRVCTPNSTSEMSLMNAVTLETSC